MAGAVAAALLMGTAAAAAIGTPTSIITAAVQTGVSATTATVTTSAAIVAGNLVVIGVGNNDNNGRNVASISDGTNSYTKADAANAGGFTTAEVWYVANAAAVGSGATITVTWAVGASSGAQVAIYGAQVSGVVSSPLDTHVNGTGSSVTHLSVSSGVLVQANEILFGMTGSAGGSSPTYSGATGFTNIRNDTSSATDVFALDYQIVAATTSVAYDPTVSGSQLRFADALASFKGN